MKIVLAAINSKYIHSNLAVRYLKAYTKDLKYNCKIREFSINDKKERVVEELLTEKPNVIAFSSYIWNIEFVREVSSLIKLVEPTIEVLYGGPEVSYDSISFLKGASGDYVIDGEGEETFREFVEYKLGEKQLKDITGLYYKGEEGNVLSAGKRPLMNMEKVAFPYEENEDLSNKIVYYEASRGCPFNCKYCLSSTIHGVRFLSIERVKKELQFLIDKKVRLVKFVDRTFNCNSNFAMAIWSFLIEQETETTFHFEVSADILKKEEIELLAKAPKGRFQFEVGVQTTNNEILRNINRFVNFEHIKEKVDELLKVNNIMQHLDLIAGLPGESYEMFKKSFNDVYSIQPEEIQLGFLKLLKGSLMREEAEKWGMVYSPYPPYEILKTKDMSYEEIIILKRVEEVVDKYYNSGKFNNILRYFLPKFEKPFQFYYELGNFFYEKGYLSRNISSADYYKVFVEFNEEFLKEDSLVLKEVIKYDYLQYNKKKWLPDFLLREINKEEERMIKENMSIGASKEVYKNLHFEKFFIDIMQWIKKGEEINGEYYLAFSERCHEDIVEVTNYLENI